MAISNTTKLVLVGGAIAVAMAGAWAGIYYVSLQPPQLMEEDERPPVVVTNGGSVHFWVDTPDLATNGGQLVKDTPSTWHHEHTKNEPQKFLVDITASSSCRSDIYPANGLDVKYTNGTEARTTNIFIAKATVGAKTKSLVINTQTDEGLPDSGWEMHVGDAAWYLDSVVIKSSSDTTCTFAPKEPKAHIKIYQKKS